jgi:hypothetical protein
MFFFAVAKQTLRVASQPGLLYGYEIPKSEQKRNKMLSGFRADLQE